MLASMERKAARFGSPERIVAVVVVVIIIIIIGAVRVLLEKQKMERIDLNGYKDEE